MVTKREREGPAAQYAFHCAPANPRWSGNGSVREAVNVKPCSNCPSHSREQFQKGMPMRRNQLDNGHRNLRDQDTKVTTNDALPIRIQMEENVTKTKETQISRKQQHETANICTAHRK